MASGQTKDAYQALLAKMEVREAETRQHQQRLRDTIAALEASAATAAAAAAASAASATRLHSSTTRAQSNDNVIGDDLDRVDANSVHNVEVARMFPFLLGGGGGSISVGSEGGASAAVSVQSVSHTVKSGNALIHYEIHTSAQRAGANTCAGEGAGAGAGAAQRNRTLLILDPLIECTSSLTVLSRSPRHFCRGVPHT